MALQKEEFVLQCPRCNYHNLVHLSFDIRTTGPFDRLATVQCGDCKRGFDVYLPDLNITKSRLATPFTKFRGYRTPYNVAYRNQI